MPACLIRRSRYSGFRTILNYSVEMLAGSRSVGRVLAPGLLCCNLWLMVAILAIRSSAMLVSPHVKMSTWKLTASQAIAASPYLPMQYGYADFVPSQSYYAFASAVGCFGPPALPQSNISASIFQCLVGKDTETLQNASSTISGSSRYGILAFSPVTDGIFVQQLPSQQLLKKQINGKRILVGVSSRCENNISLADILQNNADEGVIFTPQNIITEDDFVNFLHNTFPLFTNDDVSRVLQYYPSTNASVDMSTPEFATSGTSTPTALNESIFGTGQQQRANVSIKFSLTSL